MDRLPQQVRRRLRQPLKMRVSEHAAQYRQVTKGHVGPWRHYYAPHVVKVMDTYGLPHVREVWVCGPEQWGKTQVLLNCLHWAADCDPGDIFYLMPTEDTSSKVTDGLIKPMIAASPRLSRYLTGKQDDMTLARIKLSHGVTIWPAHANSPASMATWPAKHCLCDEVDKFPERAGKEADPVTLIRKRSRIYKGRYKRIFTSTPAGKYVWRETMRCPQVWQYQVRCPHCNEMILMDSDHLNLPDDATPESVEAAGSVEYVCNHCDVVWDDADRTIAIRAGGWVAIRGGELLRPSRVGFHSRAWECLDVPLLEIAIAWLKAKKGTIADKVAWANGYEAIDYVHEQSDRDEDHILRLVDEHMPRGIVPPGASCLVVLADTQKRGFYYEVVAFGYGQELTSWRVEHGYVETFANLTDIASKTWTDAEGRPYRAISGFIDSGGGTGTTPKHSRTVEVYQFCRANKFWKPIKGRRSMDQSWNVTRLDYFPSATGAKVPIPGGLLLYKINVTVYKNELARKLHIERDDPGAYRLHAGVGRDYARQMCAEYQDDHGWWICPRGKDNHHWDIGVYCMAAADILGVRNFRPKAAQPAGRRIISKGVTHE